MLFLVFTNTVLLLFETFRILRNIDVGWPEMINKVFHFIHPLRFDVVKGDCVFGAALQTFLFRMHEGLPVPTTL